MMDLIIKMIMIAIFIFWFVFIVIVATYATFWLIDKLEEKINHK